MTDVKTYLEWLIDEYKCQRDDARMKARKHFEKGNKVLEKVEIIVQQSAEAAIKKLSAILKNK